MKIHPSILCSTIRAAAFTLCSLITIVNAPAEVLRDEMSPTPRAAITKPTKSATPSSEATPLAKARKASAPTPQKSPPIVIAQNDSGRPSDFTSQKAPPPALKTQHDSAKSPDSSPVQPATPGERKLSKLSVAETEKGTITAIPPAPKKAENEASPAQTPKAIPPVVAKKPPTMRILNPMTEGIKERLAALPFGEVLRVQIYLDLQMFTPGKVDGLRGDFSVLAIEQWMASDHSRSLDAFFEQARSTITQTVVPFTIPEAAASHLGTVPEQLSDKAAATSLPYASLAEFVAERFHTDEDTLQRLNPAVDIRALTVGQTLSVPNVRPFEVEQVGKAPTLAKTSDVTVVIRHELRLLEVRSNQGMLLASFPITVGGKAEDIRTGRWTTAGVTYHPRFKWDEQMLKTGTPGKESFDLPPGPNNPVGILWCGLKTSAGTKAHIGIHGTDSSSRIGRNQSSGCIRLANWDIVRLASMLKPGTPVYWNKPSNGPVKASPSTQEKPNT